MSFNEKTLVVSYDAGGISRSRGYNSTFGRTFLAENNKMNINPLNSNRDQ